jgi:hypothetical protein
MNYEFESLFKELAVTRLRCHTVTCVEVLRKATKTSVKIVGVAARNLRINIDIPCVFLSSLQRFLGPTVTHSTAVDRVVVQASSHRPVTSETRV